MSNSPLISYTKLSPNHSGQRNHIIDTISIHCMAGDLSVESCGNLFAGQTVELPPLDEWTDGWCEYYEEAYGDE